MANSSKFDFIFEYPTLTKTLGGLSYQTLKIIKNELKTNAAGIDSDLGGGANGHLGLILTDVEYALVATNTPYVRHTMPSTPTFDNKSSQYEAIRRHNDLKE